MVKPILLACLTLLVLSLPAQAQIRRNPEQDVLMSSQNGSAVTVPPGSSSFLVPMVADPPVDKQDVFDIVSDNASAIITLILPNGIEVTANNAQSLGYTYAASTIPAENGLQSLAPFFTSGNHTLISLPVGAPVGTYQVKINTSNISTETLVIVSYYSSSSLRIGLLTDAATYRVNDKVVLSGLVYDGATPVTGATVTVLIGDDNDPISDPIQVVLQDSGTFDKATGDGIYTGTFTASHAGTFTAAIKATGTSPSGKPYSRIASTPFKVIDAIATFSSFSDAAVDDNSNGRPDRIVITSTINVQTPGNYFFSIQLLASNGVTVLAKARTTLQAGTRQMEASFDMDDLHKVNVNGPYTLKNAELIYEDASGGLPVVDFRKNVGTTQSYQLSTFERDPIIITGPNTITTPDNNFNGKFDKLIVDMKIDVLYDGEYFCEGTLLDSSGEEITFCSTGVGTILMAGSQKTISLSFDGQEISRSQKNGPYTIGRVYVWGNNEMTATADVLMTTSAYSYDQFDPPLMLSCSNVTVSAPPGQNSAIVDYPAPKVIGGRGYDVAYVSTTCSPARGSSFNLGPTTVTCTAVEYGIGATGPLHSATCSFTVTVRPAGTDTTPPVITVPSIAYAVRPYGQASALVYYQAPTATDDSGVVTLTCTPASGDNISRGLNIVTCTATDPAGNQSTASFQLRVFDISLEDDQSSNTLWFDSVTGDYFFFSCDGTGFNVAGRGSITLQYCQVKLNDPRVSATFIGCSYSTSGRRGSAVVKPNPVSGWYYITDSNANDNGTSNTCPIR